MFKKIVWGISIILFFGSVWVIFYAVADWNRETETQKVERLYQFYQTSGYTNWREYQKDIEDLQWIKQKELDWMDYEQSIVYMQKQTTSNQFVIEIDKAIALAKDWKTKLELPAYLKYGADTKPTTEEKSPSDLVFEKLLK